LTLSGKTKPSLCLKSICASVARWRAQVAGVLIPLPGSTAVADANGRMVQTKDTGGYWHGIPENCTPRLFSEKGSTDHADAWLPVRSFKIDKATLVVVTGNGETFRLQDFGIHFFGRFDRVTNEP
jgi:hypothetical protein